MSEASAAKQQFDEYKWEDSAEWQKYFAELYPTPAADKVIKWKQKFFKRNVNSALQIEAPPAASPPAGRPGADEGVRQRSAAPTATASSPPQHTAAADVPTRGGARQNMKTLSTALRVPALVLSLLLLQPRPPRSIMMSTAWMHIAANVALIGSKFGMPEFNMAWMQMVLADDAVLSLFFAFTSFTLGDAVLSYASPWLSSLIHFADAYRSVAMVYTPPVIEKRLTGLMDHINANRYALMQFRANIEVMLGLVVLMGFFTGRYGAFSVLLYGNALRTAYSLSAFTKSTFAQINVIIMKGLHFDFIPSALRSGYIKVAGWLHAHANQYQQ